MTMLAPINRAVPVASSFGPPRNELLASLPQTELERLRPHLARTPLSQRQVLGHAGAPADHVYFIEQGIVSLLTTAGDGEGGIEVAMVGPEGVVGLSALLAPGMPAPHHATVRLFGSALRLSGTVLCELVAELPGLRAACLGFEHTLLDQVSRTAACTGRHPLQMRCARWLLAANSRAGGEDLRLTQETLSAMLGVRRAGISVAISALQAAGCIAQRRGRIIVLDKVALASAACGCHRGPAAAGIPALRCA